MDLKSRMNVVQAKMNGTVAALTYGYMAHMNNADANIIDIGEDTNAVNSSNIENSACSSEMLRGLVHAFQDSYKGALSVDSTVCDPKYIPWNCVMKDKNGITQRGAAADLFIDYPYATKGRHQFSDGWTKSTISDTSRDWQSVCYGNNKFVAIAWNTNYFACIYTDQYDYDLIPSNTIQELSYTDITYNISITGNQSDIDAGLITFNHNNDSIYGAIPFGGIVAPQILKDAIQANQVKFIIKKYEYEYEYLNDQFYRYLTFTDNGTSYIGITNDMMHFTVYNITGSYAFRDGVILMHIPEKDAIAMITRHPTNTIVNVIDGNDPENMTDYDKPYYRLIELPFLKKYYKYNGKHVQNVKLGISTYIDTNSPAFHPLTDNTLIITVFNKVYSIGIPNWVSDNLNSQNNKCFNSTFKADSTESDATTGIQKSAIFTTYGNDSNKVIADCITTRNGSVTNILNYDFDNPEYDKPADDSTTSMTNMMRYQYNDLNDTAEPDNVIYPVTTYNPNT